MTRFQVWRYECDFCGKRGLSGGHMKRHEKHCTANPNRACRMHEHATGEPLSRPITDFVALLSAQKPDFGMAELREATGGCPMCILAAIRQSGIQKWDGDPESSPPDLQFDFKAELKSMWVEVNNAAAESKSRDYYYY